MSQRPSLAFALATLHRKTETKIGGKRMPADKRDRRIARLVLAWMRRYDLRRRSIKSIFPVEK